jgi:hypothetical protein
MSGISAESAGLISFSTLSTGSWTKWVMRL